MAIVSKRGPSVGVVVVEKEHENFYASNIFLSDGNRLAPHIHGRRPKGSVRSAEIRWRWTLKILWGAEPPAKRLARIAVAKPRSVHSRSGLVHHS
jgi:hypothetical protein